MASLTVPPIATVTADGTAATYTLSIPSGSYPHLTVIAEVAGTTGIGLLQVQFNGDSGAHYTTEGTGNRDGQTSLFWGVVAAANSGPASVFSGDIPLFASATFYKYTETRSLRNDSLKFASAAVGGRWQSTAAITSITFTLGAGGNFAAGSRIDVYAVGDSIPAATSSTLGVVEPDNATTWVDSNGVLSAGGALTTLLVSTVGAEKTYQMGTPPGGTPPLTGEPAGWTTAAFSDGGWSASVADSFGGQLTPLNSQGAAWIADPHYGSTAQPAPGGQQWLMRRDFTLPAGAVSSGATVQIAPDDVALGVYVNGSLLGSTPGPSGYGTIYTFTIPSTLLVAGGANVLAIEMRNGVSGAPGQTGVQYVLTVTQAQLPPIEVEHNGTLVGTRNTLNLIDGTGATLTVADNSGAGRVDVTVAAAGISNPMSTQDDVIVAGAAGVPARLAKGSNGTFLGIDSSSGHLAYETLAAGSGIAVTQVGGTTTIAASGGGAGGTAWTSIADTTVVTVGGVASITFAGIDTSAYKHLYLLIEARSSSTGGATLIQAQFNSDTGANYYGALSQRFATSFNESFNAGGTSLTVGECAGGATGNAAQVGAAGFWLVDYAGTTFWKTVTGTNGFANSTGAGGQLTGTAMGEWANTAAITTIKLFLSAGNFVVGSRATLWGIN